MRKPIHPGEVLREEFLIPLDMEQTALAKDLGVDFKTINRLVNEQSKLSPSMAIRLAKFFDTTPEFWLNIQRAIDLYDAQSKVDTKSSARSLQHERRKHMRVKVIADSTYRGSRITTLECIYPRFIHSQVLTHRVFSRNSSSSRAIPIRRLLETGPVAPSLWGSAKHGMQAGNELTGLALVGVKMTWYAGWYFAKLQAYLFHLLGLHKQAANRVLEPYTTVRVLITSTDFQSFLDLRLHEDAQPEIQELAWHIKNELGKSRPKVLKEGEWHLPYAKDFGVNSNTLKISAARCARVSYQSHDGTRTDPMKDIALADVLIRSKHWSPFEHQAQACQTSHSSGNLRGPWIQYRQMKGLLVCSNA